MGYSDENVDKRKTLFLQSEKVNLIKMGLMCLFIVADLFTMKKNMYLSPLGQI